MVQAKLQGHHPRHLGFTGLALPCAGALDGGWSELMHLQPAGSKRGHCNTPALAGFQGGGCVDADESGLKRGAVGVEPANQGAEVCVNLGQAPRIGLLGVRTKHPRLDQLEFAIAALKQCIAEAACAGVNAENAGASGCGHD